MAECSIPPNTKANVYIPPKQNATITENGKGC